MVLRQCFSERTNHSPCGLRRLNGRLQFLGGARQALLGGRKEGPRGRQGSVVEPCGVWLKSRTIGSTQTLKQSQETLWH